MSIDLLSVVKSCVLFSSLSDSEIQGLILKCDRVYLRKNQILFRQGALSDGMYLLVRGRAVGVITTDLEEQKIIGEIKPGETIGELGAISREPRTATIRALENSILLKLSNDAFLEVYRNYPSVSLGVINTFVTRSRTLLRRIAIDEMTTRHVVIIPANRKVSLEKFSTMLMKLVQSIPYAALVSEFSPEFTEKNYTSATLRNLLDGLEQNSKTVIYLLASHRTLLAKMCFENADMIYIVANSDSKRFISRFVLEKIGFNKVALKIKPQLILLHEDVSRGPLYTARWLALTNFDLCHHIRINYDKDCKRLLRFLCGQAVGVVLGGGGVRSWAHLGAVKALHEAGIPIDIIGGTSAGAIAAGQYALDDARLGSMEGLQSLSETTRNAASFRNLTWPAVSIFNGKDYTEQHKILFGSAKIENLWLPCFFISCNLSDSTEAVHQRGYLWKAIRASTAVPAIFPPVVIKGELHLDGGILNNLPVDVMRRMVGNGGTVIAVELTHHSKDQIVYNFPTVLPFWQTMLAKSKLAFKDYKFPSFMEAFLKTLLAGSSAKQELNSLAADMLISPDLSSYSLLNVSKEEEAELIKLGYEAAIKAIKKWKSKTARKMVDAFKSEFSG